MALTLDDQPKRRLPLWRVIMLVVLGCALVLLGWYSYRWYMYGDELPIDVPAVFVSADPNVDETEVTDTQVSEHSVGATAPRYLSIPKLGIDDVRVFGMGVNDEGALADPVNISDVAWYNEGPAPGSGDVILMNGHNGGTTRNGVFAGLHTLERGDVIEVERGDGQIFRYEVRENQSMPLEEVNETGMQMMMRSAEPGKEALNVITCDGKWVPRFQQFDRRIMLRAVLLDS